MIVPMHAFTTPDPTMEQMLLHLRQASDIARAAMEQGHHPFGAIEVIVHQPPSLGRQRQEPEHVAAG